MDLEWEFIDILEQSLDLVKRNLAESNVSRKASSYAEALSPSSSRKSSMEDRLKFLEDEAASLRKQIEFLFSTSPDSTDYSENHFTANEVSIKRYSPASPSPESFSEVFDFNVPPLVVFDASDLSIEEQCGFSVSYCDIEKGFNLVETTQIDYDSQLEAPPCECRIDIEGNSAISMDSSSLILHHVDFNSESAVKESESQDVFSWDEKHENLQHNSNGMIHKPSENSFYVDFEDDDEVPRIVYFVPSKKGILNVAFKGKFGAINKHLLDELGWRWSDLPGQNLFPPDLFNLFSIKLAEDV